MAAPQSPTPWFGSIRPQKYTIPGSDPPRDGIIFKIDPRDTLLTLDKQQQLVNEVLAVYRRVSPTTVPLKLSFVVKVHDALLSQSTGTETQPVGFSSAWLALLLPLLPLATEFLLELAPHSMIGGADEARRLAVVTSQAERHALKRLAAALCGPRPPGTSLLLRPPIQVHLGIDLGKVAALPCLQTRTIALLREMATISPYRQFLPVVSRVEYTHSQECFVFQMGEGRDREDKTSIRFYAMMREIYKAGIFPQITSVAAKYRVNMLTEDGFPVYNDPHQQVFHQAELRVSGQLSKSGRRMLEIVERRGYLDATIRGPQQRRDRLDGKLPRMMYEGYGFEGTATTLVRDIKVWDNSNVK